MTAPGTQVRVRRDLLGRADRIDPELRNARLVVRAILPDNRLLLVDDEGGSHRWHASWLEEAGEEPARAPTRSERRGALRAEMRRRLADSPLARLDGCPAIAEIREWLARQDPETPEARAIADWLRDLGRSA